MSVKAKLVEKADSKFVDNWREAHKWLSVRFAIVFGVVTSLLTTYPDEVAKMIDALPQEFRIPLGFVVTTILPIYLRLKTQN